mgnify:FL=1
MPANDNETLRQQALAAPWQLAQALRQAKERLKDERNAKHRD